MYRAVPSPSIMAVTTPATWKEFAPWYSGPPSSPLPWSKSCGSAQQANSTALFNAAAQSWNHAFLWQSMRSGGGGEASGDIAALIQRDFAGHQAFCREFVA